MRVLVSGSSGMIGSALTRLLKSDGHDVVRLVRSDPSGPNEVRWDPSRDFIDRDALESIEAVVHLAGESLADGRWTAQKKARIHDTREIGTRLLSTAIASAGTRPKVLISASAVGIYGDRGEERLTEESEFGKGFLADVCRDWEAATEPAAAAGVRVIKLRIGMVLGESGGALSKMLLPFKLGVGGKIGSGKQYMSWIVLDDLTAAIEFLLNADAVSGPVNAVSPAPVTNAEFTSAMGKVLSRPTFFAVPAFGARAVFGEMADEVLLAGARVLPEKLEQAGFKFKFTDIESGLRHCIK